MAHQLCGFKQTTTARSPRAPASSDRLFPRAESGSNKGDERYLVFKSCEQSSIYSYNMQLRVILHDLSVACRFLPECNILLGLALSKYKQTVTV